MPQNLIDTPADWQDTIVVPQPGEPAAMANDPQKPHSLYHALAAIAKRTRWLRALLEGHNHDDRYAPADHNHDDRYYTKTQADARYAPVSHNHDDRYYTKPEVDARLQRMWVALSDGADVSLTVPDRGAVQYLIQGMCLWQSWGDCDFRQILRVDGNVVWDLTRKSNTHVGGPWHTGTWWARTVVSLGPGEHVFRYTVLPTVYWGGVAYLGSAMLRAELL